MADTTKIPVLRTCLKIKNIFISDHEVHEQSLIKVWGGQDSSETDVCSVLAVHLFSKLIPEGEIIINKNTKGLAKTVRCC